MDSYDPGNPTPMGPMTLEGGVSFDDTMGLLRAGNITPEQFDQHWGDKLNQKGAKAEYGKGRYGEPAVWDASGMSLDLADPSSFDPGNYGNFRGAGPYVGATATDPGGYMGAGGQVAHVNSLFSGMGINPMDTSEAIRRAGHSRLNQENHAAAVADAARLQQMGQGGSGTAAALSTLRNVGFGGERANIDMTAAIDAANRAQHYDDLKLGIAGQHAAAVSGHDLSRAGLLNDFSLQSTANQNAFNLDSARMANDFENNRSAYELARSGMLSDDDFRRSTAEYEANILTPIQIDMAKDAGKKAQRLAIAEIGLGAISDAAQMGLTAGMA